MIIVVTVVLALSVGYWFGYRLGRQDGIEGIIKLEAALQHEREELAKLRRNRLN
ncbi:hypothetical protein HY224_03135 [Candidatus Uhrbacteria bacterium]|nr:hypothetical protein [Candidatus Uhrbacteria bacterium]